MKDKETILIASHGTIDGIVSCINRYYFGTEEKSWSINVDTLDVIRPDGSVNTGSVVKKKGKRYRFELIK